MDKSANNHKLKIVLAGGGTGGHIYPAIAIGRELLTRNNVEKVFYVGNPKKLENDIVEKEDFEFLPVLVSGMPKTKNLSLIKWFIELGFAVIKTLHYFKNIKPDCVMGTGGYVSGPALIAAKIMKIPYVLHDSDAIPGIVSRKMAPGAKAINTSFDEAKKYLKSNNIVVYGNPLRNDFNSIDKKESLKELGLNPDKFTILVMGGSQGAKSVNEAISSCALDLIENLNLQIIHQTGLKNYEEYMDKISPELRNNKNYLPKAYLENMGLYLSCADLVIARSGSLSLSEFNLCGLPSILIPYPHAAHNHQYHNAKALEELKAAVCLEDNLCDGDNLTEIVTNLVKDKERLLR
ncbi:MAG: undecaprenyldiphospho-muramoylpentapeptide beta-N-acetylglucosaminyltransferase [Candidatus Gastranaerophilales bacterium]|nr:undecaprenyldiphospho-muramoylpentapeptide beta-N-acetylglucosaminyltransferase [Candidatus Gastranaerophilales bacterium]